LDVAELEYHAEALHALQVVVVPGLLQTERYVRALFNQGVPELPKEHLEALIEFRLKRRQIIEMTDPVPVDFIVHEAALRIRVGDRKVAREQLSFIMEMSERPAVSVRVVPFETDGFTGSAFSMLYIEGPVRQLDTAQFDTVSGSIFVDSEAELARFRGVLRDVERVSLSPVKSRDLIHEIERHL
jgi:hypothetical protein